MEQDLISKKDLLDVTGISYGQLYRWKRKQLIPEEWFIRKSTFTGQETFFPKEMILARIHNIVNMKDDLSLDELAGKLSDSSALYTMTWYRDELVKRNIVSNVTMDKFGELPAGRVDYDFDQLLHLYTVDVLLGKGELNLEEAGLLYRTLRTRIPRLEGKSCELFFIRKMGVSSFLLALSPAELLFDEGVRLVARVNLDDLVEKLKGKLS
ncbi:YhbD family protein [Paenibacillus sp. sgz500958]|uniref:YhbD family protein n=1 Tax=Paenibacillus sp. sgz500958 TaxID=3242475 RepID=UPI0036D2914B